MTDRLYYVYIMSNTAGITYIGVTNDLYHRVQEHKSGTIPGFAAANKTRKLVYYEEFHYIHEMRSFARSKSRVGARKRRER